MIGIIAAVSSNGVIGVNGKIPWEYPEDLKYFRITTLNSTIVMGRHTFDSIGKPLPKRNNVVITSSKSDIPGVTIFKSISEFMDHRPDGPVWFVGGAKIYEEAMEYADQIHLTLIPTLVSDPNSVKFPWINPMKFKKYKVTPFEFNSELNLCIYKRR